MLKKEILIKFAVVGTVVVLPLDSWSQDEGGLVPGRLEIGDAAPGDEVKVTEKGQLLPGDIDSRLPNIDLPAPDPRDDIQKSFDLLPESIRNMDKAKQDRIRDLLDEAANFIQGIRIQEGLDRLLKIEELTKDFYATYNLRGAIYTKLRDFDKARAAFQKALELRPGLMEAMFNLAELDFVEKKFAAAETAFRKLKEEHSNRFASHADAEKLIDYKLFISTLLQSTAPGDSKEREALAMLEEYDLRLMSVAAPDELSDSGESLIIVALVGDDLHIRIFDGVGQRVVDKAEAELVKGQDLTDLKEMLNKIPFSDGPSLSDNDLKKWLNEIQFPDDDFTLADKRSVINKATSIAGFTHFDYLDDYPGFYYSQAALAFHQGREQDAEDWMASASRIYSKAIQSIYIDALIEMGWVEAL